MVDGWGVRRQKRGNSIRRKKGPVEERGRVSRGRERDTGMDGKEKEGEEEEKGDDVELKRCVSSEAGKALVGLVAMGNQSGEGSSALGAGEAYATGAWEPARDGPNTALFLVIIIQLVTQLHGGYYCQVCPQDCSPTSSHGFELAFGDTFLDLLDPTASCHLLSNDQ
jgi:hypothetical protein